MGTTTKIRIPGIRGMNRKAAKKLQRQSKAAIGIGVVATTLTALSLSHLAHGIEIVCCAPSWQGWAMAVGIDCGFIGLELASISAATVHVGKQIATFAKPAIIGTLVLSALMNAFAFAEAATGVYLTVAAIMIGLAIPALIYALTRVGAAMYIDCHTRS